MTRDNLLPACLLLATLALAGCGGGGSSSSSTVSNDLAADSSSGSASSTTDSSSATDGSSTVDTPGLDPTLFLTDGLVSAISEEPCTLSGGTQATCYRIEIGGVPANTGIGPFCPSSIFSDATEGGIWFDGGGEVYDVDGAFIENLATLYNDANWLLYDPGTGNVNVTDTQVACEAAARPNVAAEYQNHCVECSIDYYGGGVAQTLLIPTVPVPLTAPAALTNGDVGVALNGVILAPPAPVNAILAAYTIAAFDDCGGHVNPVAGYHYHGATGCSDIQTQADGHAAILGYAMDGYGIYGMLDDDGQEAADLDGCRGHTDQTRGYHYHAASAGENMFIGCFNGQQGSVQ